MPPADIKERITDIGLAAALQAALTARVADLDQDGFTEAVALLVDEGLPTP